MARRLGHVGIWCISEGVAAHKPGLQKIKGQSCQILYGHFARPLARAEIGCQEGNPVLLIRVRETK